MDIGYIFSVVLLALGFGFVIFWHELGHFLAAKWAGVKVEQFAVGFGTAALAWRKGIGVRIGSTRREYEARCREYLLANEGAIKSSRDFADATNDEQRLDAAGRALGLGETEYRLNWLPLGGYVKMLGQDDLNPNATVSDPRAYNVQSIGKRMVIVSAGVIMNVILAAVFFCGLFLFGFNAPPPVVGVLAPNSPAQRAGLQVGDEILTIDGKTQHDFTKIYLTVALLPDGQDVPVTFLRPETGKQVHTASVRPGRNPNDARGMLSLGIGQPFTLRSAPLGEVDEETLRKQEALMSPLLKTILPGDTLIAVGGKPIEDPARDFYLLDRALQASGGKPVEITVRTHDGTIQQRQIEPFFETPYSDPAPAIAGMLPRVRVMAVSVGSPAVGKVEPDDIITSLRIVGPNDRVEHPSRALLIETVNRAGDAGNEVEVTVLRNGNPVTLQAIKPYKLPEQRGKVGLGVAPGADERHAVIGGVVADSPAGRAKVPQGAQVISVNDVPVTTWHDIREALLATPADAPARLAFKPASGGETHVVDLRLDKADVEQLSNMRYTTVFAALGMPPFDELKRPRKTENPIEAAMWGAEETRDLIVQFYITLKRMTQGSVPASNMMGPLGIVQAGSRFAYKGNDWLIWFLAMISANLAVVNFLPIPIVDGGLFLFLIIEKIQGKPISPRTQSIAQVVGLALILSVFIFVTYQDIVR